jgi:hypothetical protein
MTKPRTCTSTSNSCLYRAIEACSFLGKQFGRWRRRGGWSGLLKDYHIARIKKQEEGAKEEAEKVGAWEQIDIVRDDGVGEWEQQGEFQQRPTCSNRPVPNYADAAAQTKKEEQAIIKATHSSTAAVVLLPSSATAAAATSTATTNGSSTSAANPSTTAGATTVCPSSSLSLARASRIPIPTTTVAAAMAISKILSAILLSSAKL